MNARRTIGPSWANRAITIGLISGLSRETNCHTRMLLSAPAATIDLAVGAERAGVFGFERLGKRVHPLAVLDPPDLAGVVGAGTHQEAAVGTEGHVIDRAGVPFQRTEQLAGSGVPHLDLLVVAAGGQPHAVGRELGVVEDVAMAGELADRAHRRRRSRSPRPRPGRRLPRP